MFDCLVVILHNTGYTAKSGLTVPVWPGLHLQQTGKITVKIFEWM